MQPNRASATSADPALTGFGTARHGMQPSPESVYKEENPEAGKSVRAAWPQLPSVEQALTKNTSRSPSEEPEALIMEDRQDHLPSIYVISFRDKRVLKLFM